MKNDKEIKFAAIEKIGDSIYSVDEVDAYEEGYNDCKIDALIDIKVLNDEIAELKRLCKYKDEYIASLKSNK
jgi:hypothetical protein